MNDMQSKEVLQRITLVQATALGWIQPDHADSLDELVYEARRWLDKWHKDYNELGWRG